VDVDFQELRTEFRPADWIEQLRQYLPNRYAPLRSNGHGVQSIYLTELPEPLALVLADLLGAEVGALARAQVVAERGIVSPSVNRFLEEYLPKNEQMRLSKKQKGALSRTARPGSSVVGQRRENPHAPRSGLSISVRVTSSPGATATPRIDSTGKTDCF
jgi:hypothetical protein